VSDLRICTPRWGSDHRERKALAIYATLVSAIGPRTESATWVDVGCGSGGIAAALSVLAGNVIGVDPEPWPDWDEMCVRQTNLSFLVSRFDGDQPPIADASADIVVCNQVYEHVSDPAALLRNIYRILKPGGVCYFAGPNLLWPIEPHVFWPFVHWMPRKTALALMNLLGSNQASDLDAASLDWWRLTSLIDTTGFERHDGIKARLVGGLKGTRIEGLLTFLPNRLFAFLAPVSPGFVFILYKSAL
jgi:SAM-dependent methyltransferase